MVRRRSLVWSRPPQPLCRWILSLLALTQIHRVTSFQGSGWERADRSPIAMFAHGDEAETGAKVNGLKPRDVEETIMNQRHMRFTGVGRLYARDDIGDKAASEYSLEAHLSVVDRLTESTVAVVGLGGVGSWAAEALCRSGVGNLILIDLDDICVSNTNRQLHAMSSTIGQMKIDETRRRVLDINPQCNVTLIHDFVSAENVYELLDRMLPDLDVCLDAIDGAKEKTALIAACTRRKVPVVTCGAAAGKMDPTKIVAEDLTRVSDDRLLATCRKDLRKRHGFGKGLPITANRQPRKWRIPAVYSKEVLNPLPNKNANDASSLRRCDGVLGTACFVTGTFGFVAAGEVVRMLATGKFAIPRKDHRHH